MDISIDIAWLVAVLLVAIRIGAAFALTPVFGAPQIPMQARVITIVTLAVALVGAAGVHPAGLPTSIGALGKAAISELVTGAFLAFAIFAAFGAFLLGGRIIDMQVGFSVANLIDPVTRTQSPLIGTFLNLLAVVIFLSIGGDHMLVRGLAYSVERIPPGTPIGQIDLGAIVTQFGAMFVYAVMLVAPVIFSLLFVDVGLAVMARTMPQVNVFIVSLPLKVLIGLLVLAISLNYLGPVLEKIFGSIFIFWQNVLAT